MPKEMDKNFVEAVSANMSIEETPYEATYEATYLLMRPQTWRRLRSWTRPEAAYGKDSINGKAAHENLEAARLPLHTLPSARGRCGQRRTGRGPPICSRLSSGVDRWLQEAYQVAGLDHGGLGRILLTGRRPGSNSRVPVGGAVFKRRRNSYKSFSIKKKTVNYKQ